MYSNLYRIALCLSHARLSLRKDAVEEDAVLAIMLYEEALVHKTGNDNTLYRYTQYSHYTFWYTSICTTNYGLSCTTISL